MRYDYRLNAQATDGKGSERRDETEWDGRPREGGCEGRERTRARGLARSVHVQHRGSGRADLTLEGTGGGWNER